MASGGYAAAAYNSSRSRLWTVPLEETINPKAPTRLELLTQARYHAANTPIASRILSVVQHYGIGAGLFPTSATGFAEYDAAATEAFEQWANSSFASADASQSFFEMQKAMIKSLVLTGELFILLEKSENGYPQLRIVESENVKSSGKKDDKSIDGIFYDQYGRAVAYQIANGKEYIRVDASNVIHVILNPHANQRRGITAFAPCLTAMHDRNDMLNLEKQAVKIHTALAVFVSKQGGLSSGSIMGDFAAADPQAHSAENARALEQALGAKIIYGEPGDKAELLASERSTDNFLNHLELLDREVAKTFSMSYEFLINSEKLNGTAIRLVMMDAEVYLRGLQDALIDGAFNRIFAWVISSLKNQGKLTPPAGAKVWLCSWTRPIAVTVDKGRVSSAEIEQLKSGLLSYRKFYEERGLDWKEQLTQRAEEEAFLDALAAEKGISVSRINGSLAATPAPAPDQAAA